MNIKDYFRGSNVCSFNPTNVYVYAAVLVNQRQTFLILSHEPKWRALVTLHQTVNYMPYVKLKR